jgi:hypothetical protein
LHFTILIGGADSGVQGATHIIIVHYFRTFVNVPQEYNVACGDGVPLTVSVSQNRVILVSGIPASGKSTFCRWLHTAKGWEHVDVDFASGYASLSQILDRLRRSPVGGTIDWGFPPAYLGVVKSLVQQINGFWWFTGDEQAAKLMFQRRLERSEHTASLDAFNYQMGQIKANWQQIREVFKGHIINSILPGPRYKTSEALFEEMCL